MTTATPLPAKNNSPSELPVLDTGLQKAARIAFHGLGAASIGATVSFVADFWLPDKSNLQKAVKFSGWAFAALATAHSTYMAANHEKLTQQHVENVLKENNITSATNAQLDDTFRRKGWFGEDKRPNHMFLLDTYGMFSAGLPLELGMERFSSVMMGHKAPAYNSPLAIAAVTATLIGSAIIDRNLNKRTEDYMVGYAKKLLEERQQTPAENARAIG
jgi:hypothetical protein